MIVVNCARSAPALAAQASAIFRVALQYQIMEAAHNAIATVAEATAMVMATARDFGREVVPFTQCTGRVLAEPVFADRDLPPYNRVMMDGYGLHSASVKGEITSFAIAGVQPAGAPPAASCIPGACVEIMTGAMLPPWADMVIPYEETLRDGDTVLVRPDSVKAGRFVHPRGQDGKKDILLVAEGSVLTPAAVAILATVGKTEVAVKNLPAITILSTGDELVDIDEVPDVFQIRRSNSYALQAVLRLRGVAATLAHLPDDRETIQEKLSGILEVSDAVILSGGVSMGKMDYLPGALESLGVQKIFHKVMQRPGKPFWFGSYQGRPVFAFPGNPVSAFMCMHRYFIPWLDACMAAPRPSLYAVLGRDFVFQPRLQYFLQVQLEHAPDGRTVAHPVEGNGSGDFVNLLTSGGFLELPMERDFFYKGECFRVWPF